MSNNEERAAFDFESEIQRRINEAQKQREQLKVAIYAHTGTITALKKLLDDYRLHISGK